MSRSRAIESSQPRGLSHAAHGDQLGGGEVGVERGVLGDEAEVGPGVGVLARVPSEDADLPGVGPEQADGEVEQGGLAGAVGPDQGGDPSGRELQ